MDEVTEAAEAKAEAEAHDKALKNLATSLNSSSANIATGIVDLVRAIGLSPNIAAVWVSGINTYVHALLAVTYGMKLEDAREQMKVSTETQLSNFDAAFASVVQLAPGEGESYQ
jgi:hypothetical protein